MKRMDMINAMIIANGFERYLEIGAQSGKCFIDIECKEKVCLDIRKSFDGLTYKMSSDEFFQHEAPKLGKFDIVFIDGLHERDQVIKDIENSFKYLNKGGVIMMHDCNPKEEKHQTMPPSHMNWTGNVWRAFLHMRLKHPEYEMFVIDSDWGVGVISKVWKPTHKVLDITEKITYKQFAEKREEILNLISPDLFMERLMIMAE